MHLCLVCSWYRSLASEVNRSCPTLCDPMDCSRQLPPSMEFSRQEYWSGLPFPSPGDLPNPGIEPGSFALQADSLPFVPPKKPQNTTYGNTENIYVHICARPFRTNTPKKCPFHYKGLECKSRKSRNTWNNRQIWPWNMEWSRAKINRVLPRKCTGHSKHPLPTTQEKTLHMDIIRWSALKSDWLYSLQPKIEKLYTVNKNKTRSWLWIRSWTSYCQIQTEIEESREIH